MPNAKCLSYISTQDSYMAEKNQTNQTKPNQKLNQPNCSKPFGLSYFCELSLHTKFQFPRLCLSEGYVPMANKTNCNQTKQRKPS